MVIPILFLSLLFHTIPFQGSFAVIGTVKDTSGQKVTSIRVSLLDENYHSIRTIYERGAEYLKDDKFDQADATLRKAIEIFPDYYQALELLGTEYVKRGQYADALPILTHATDINGRGAKSLYSLGVANLKLNKPAEAAEWLKKAASLSPTNANTYVMLGQAFGNNRQYDQAVTALKKAIELGGDQAVDVHFYLASIYNKQNKYGEAIKELEIYLKEGKEIDRAKIKAAIENLKAKEKARN
jgi:tetratricopeptide (TPR) repeat protein